MTWSHALKAKLCPAAFLRVSGNGAAPPYTFCFLLLTSTKLLPASGCGSGSVLHHFYCDSAPLSTSFESKLPQGKQEGEWAYGVFCCLHQKNYLIKNHWKPHAFAEMALLQRNLSRQISE